MTCSLLLEVVKTEVAVEGEDCVHVFIAHVEVEHINVFCKTLLADRLWHKSNTPLGNPSEDDLSYGFAVPLGDFDQNGILEQCWLTFPVDVKMKLYLVHKLTTYFVNQQN